MQAVPAPKRGSAEVVLASAQAQQGRGLLSNTAYEHFPFIIFFASTFFIWDWAPAIRPAMEQKLANKKPQEAWINQLNSAPYTHRNTKIAIASSRKVGETWDKDPRPHSVYT